MSYIKTECQKTRFPRKTDEVARLATWNSTITHTCLQVCLLLLSAGMIRNNLFVEGAMRLEEALQYDVGENGNSRCTARYSA